MCKEKAGKSNRDLYLLKSLFCRNGPEIRLYFYVQTKQKNGNSEPLSLQKDVVVLLCCEMAFWLHSLGPLVPSNSKHPERAPFLSTSETFQSRWQCFPVG